MDHPWLSSVALHAALPSLNLMEAANRPPGEANAIWIAIPNHEGGEETPETMEAGKLPNLMGLT